MSDPLTIGGLVVAAIKIAAPEAVKAAVGEAVKGAYRSLTDRLLRSASAEVAMLEASPDSLDKQLAVAEIIDAQPDTDKDDLKVLAENLLAKLKERAPAIGLRPVSMDFNQPMLPRGSEHAQRRGHAGPAVRAVAGLHREAVDAVNE